jgi:iron complex transport system ATP-binding protein
MNDNLYIVRNVSFSYKKDSHVLRGVDFNLDGGEFVALIGPNGSGKSTLLKLMAGLLKSDSGEITFKETPVDRVPPRELAKQVAYLPQEDEFHFPFTVGEIVMLGRWPHSGGAFFDSALDREAASRAINLVGISQWSNRQVTELSGGERARVMLAKAVATEPRCFLLDEPVSELDLKYRADAYRILRDLADRGAGVVVVAHDVGAVSRWSDRMVLLSDGHVLADGKPDSVLTESLLKTAYGVDVKVISDGTDRAIFAVAGEGGSR